LKKRQYKKEKKENTWEVEEEKYHQSSMVDALTRRGKYRRRITFQKVVFHETRRESKEDNHHADGYAQG